MKLFAWIVLLTGVLLADSLLGTVSTSSSPPSSASSSRRPELFSRSKRTPPTEDFEGKHIFHVDRFVRDFKHEFGYLPNSEELKEAIQDKTANAVAGLYRWPPRMVTVLLLTDAEFKTLENDKMNELHRVDKMGRPEYKSKYDYTFVDLSVESSSRHLHLAIKSFERGKFLLGKEHTRSGRQFIQVSDNVSHFTKGLADAAALARQVAYENELKTHITDGITLVKETRESIGKQQKKVGQRYKDFTTSKGETPDTCGKIGHSTWNSCSCRYITIRKNKIKKKLAELAKEAKKVTQAKLAKKEELAKQRGSERTKGSGKQDKPSESTTITPSE